ncbi:ING3-like protein [Mya arenaria]|uniref:Inhibitor of growth protein n=1 Tax=Mya arenaria TaxID=6604 RepID=A0ABY7FZI9_MYAAR|nr:ING3-like protein [Mya arenaria]
MLYLEDYLEMIENLPMEMRERLTEMREMDLQVQNALDGLDERVTSFFKKCTQPNLKLDWRDEQFGKIKKDYYKTLEDADEKVQLANHIYDLDLWKWINHLLRTTELKQEKRLTTEKVLSTLANEIARDSFGPVRKTHSASSSPNISMFNSAPSSTSIPYKIGKLCCDDKGCEQFRPDTGLHKAGVPAVQQTTKAAALLQAQQAQQQAHQQKQQAAVMSALSQQLTAVDPPPSVPAETPNELQIVDENGETVNWQDDPNEPRYCLCNQVSYGEMVGCDNDDCPIEWFHYPCVGLTQAPKGKWYCPQCTAALKRRGRR